MTEIRFDVTEEEQQLIEKIIERVRNFFPEKFDAGQLNAFMFEMDLCACHANGCPLDFKRLLEFPEFDFMHDIAGIVQHIDRQTGQLQHCFLPRCYKGD